MSTITNRPGTPDTPAPSPVPAPPGCEHMDLNQLPAEGSRITLQRLSPALQALPNQQIVQTAMDEKVRRAATALWSHPETCRIILQTPNGFYEIRTTMTPSRKETTALPTTNGAVAGPNRTAIERAMVAPPTNEPADDPDDVYRCAMEELEEAKTRRQGM